MALVPSLIDDFWPVSSPWNRDWESVFSPEEVMYPIRNVLNQLSTIEQDNSITIDKDNFVANIDVQQFKPEEITVRMENDNTVVVEGKHEEKQDEHGFISRHFVRWYVLPEDCDIQKLQCKLSSDGVLSVSAPKRPEGKQVDCKVIPITLTGPVRKIQRRQKKWWKPRRKQQLQTK